MTVFATVVALEWCSGFVSILLLDTWYKGCFATWLTLLLGLYGVNVHWPRTLRLFALFLVLLLVTTLAVSNFDEIVCILNAFSK